MKVSPLAVILGVLAFVLCAAIGFYIGFNMAFGPRKKERNPQAEIQSLITGLETFRVDVGRYPTTEEGLDALVKSPAGLRWWHGPYAESAAFTDPWGRPYVYTIASKFEESFEIRSAGRDGKLNTSDDIVVNH
jgi:general secretion pathway protein G